MKIWIINHYAIPPSMGGLVRHYYFTKFLKEKGHDVKLFSSSMIHNSSVNMITDKSLFLEKNMDGVEYTFVRTSDYKGNGISRIINMLQFPVRIWKVCKKLEKPDVIYVSSPDPFTALSAIIMGKVYHVKKILEVRDLWPESIVQYNSISKKNIVVQILYQLEKWLYCKADKIVFTMEGGYRYIQDKGWDKKIDKNKVYNLNNGVDLEEFEYNRNNYKVDDPDLHDDNLFKVVYTGSIRKVYNMDMIVECANQLKDIPNIKFLIWGDGTEKVQLMEKCKGLGLSNIVFKGQVEKKYIPYILSKADINLMHWRKTELVHYGCSLNKLFEYLAAGRMIVSDVKNEYDLLERFNCGIVTDEQNEEDLCEAILLCRNMSQEEKNTYYQNMNVCIKQYDFKALTEKLEIIMQSRT